ncbi:type I phosphodiesterase/nucleotide pyrophosphatase [Penicillium digitatum]|uniref:Uncharacterized protein n=3 Tax=Penicillium digitatum TaxID=36651 RepID=K9FSY6_PEND2|nr:hypothetical protein PDIP_17580 [Penicillium digitatum Pd1]EKV12239.1 hypothetical protein PDIG_45640 [Penicillium digitatum PHI26]EKV20326.1 hypothetical protein PDIP_17580 [Penicillium digitatum Pd1]KAG0160541.1 hypothetical protein PDIDSM_8071 [Penicillium digitatum]QQK45363.1 type I phosphodiesterase/nucleotide pyrophosphatase [Penicillium digitatum]
MNNLFPRLFARDDSNSDDSDSGLSDAMLDLLIALLVLVLLSLVLIGGLLILRRKRQFRNKNLLPVYNGESPNRRHLTISTNKNNSVLVYDEKRRLMENSYSPPPSPVPEIRITFPEEEDASGKRTSRMVVVRISDAGSIGLEPCHEELPPYQSTDTGRFQSLDIERMGGLKEKAETKTYH